MPECKVDLTSKKAHLDLEEKKHQHGEGEYQHEAIYLSVSKQDSILWGSSEENFELLRVRKDPKAPRKLRKKGAPSNPFYRSFPAKAKKDGCVSSGPARAEAVGQQYRYEYKLGKTVVDPHIIVGP